MGNANGRPASVKLTYFDIRGVAEPIRIAFAIGGIPFEDNRIGKDDWMNLKPKTPYGSLPLLEVDGRTFAQSEAILRYAGKLSGLYPANNLEAMKVDELLGAVEDCLAVIRPSVREPDEHRKKEMRKNLSEEVLPKWFGTYNKIIEDNGTGWMYGKSISVVDLKLYALLKWISSGVLDGVSESLVSQFEKLTALVGLVEGHEKVAKYYASKGSEK